MNNEMIRNHYDAFSRMEAFGQKYADQFAPASRAAAQFAVITGVTGAMEAEGVEKLSGTQEFRGGRGRRR